MSMMSISDANNLESSSANNARWLLTYEHALWAGLLLLAALMRLWFLEVAPLNNGEAQAALQALALVKGTATTLGNPLLGALQALLFSLLNADGFSARFISALAGSAICLIPISQRKTLGRTRAFVMGLLLALSPTLWFASRQADGGLLAWLLAFSVWSAWKADNKSITAILLGLLLACGADAIAPTLTLLAIWFANSPHEKPDRRFWVMTLATLVFSATGLLFNVAGLGQLFAGYATWFSHLVQATGLPLGRAMMGMLYYELALLIGAIGSVIALALTRQIERDELPWLIWIGAGLIVLIINQSRSANDVIPIVIGLSGLASHGLNRILISLQTHGQLRYEGSYTAIAVGLFFFAGLGLRQYASSGETSWLMPVLICLVMSLALVTSANLLNDAGIGVRALLIALTLHMGLYSIATGTRLNLFQPDNPAEAYVLDVAQPELNTLAQTVQTLSTRAFGDPNTMPVQVSSNAPPALLWALRNQSAVNVSDNTGNASVLITPEAKPPEPRGSNGFSGNGFVIFNRQSLDAMRCRSESTKIDCVPLAKWVAFRRADNPTPERWVLWVRGDVANAASGIQ